MLMSLNTVKTKIQQTKFFRLNYKSNTLLNTKVMFKTI